MTKLSPISKFKVFGNSMLPTFYSGQDIISFNWAYLGRKTEIGEVIVIKYSGKEIVKRVKNIEGENVFVEGDNQKESTDSRHFGPINKGQIVGKVIYASNEVPCVSCDAPIVGIAGKKDAICSNCGFKLTYYGEP